jgi:pilus assembly protein TadC
MTAAMISGALVGLGCYLLARTFMRPRPGVAVQVARLDAAQRAAARAGSGASGGPGIGPGIGPGVAGGGASAGGPAADAESRSSTSALRASLGERLELEAAARGWRLPRLRADLALLGRELGPLLATKVLLALGALVWVPLLWFAARIFGIPAPPLVPALFSLLAAALAFVLPDFALHEEAERKRKDFRHVLGCFLDLVAMNLAGGRGLPEALLAASSVGQHWAMARIRSTLAGARLAGRTPWDALGRLGSEIGLEELRDLAGALTLAGEDGAKVRSSLSARAASIRRKELADAEGQAGERSQSMLVAQLLICAAFLVFLGYPATYQILHT